MIFLNSWGFWFLHRDPKNKFPKDDYESTLVKIAVFQDAQAFWSIFGYLKRPSIVPIISDIFLFKKDKRPTWEDQPEGGKWILRLKKGIVSRYWEKLVLALIGEQFQVDDICGAVISLRHSEDILSVWTADANSTNNFLIRYST